MVLDLNNDGVINTFAASQLNGALFDHDGDGIRTSSGWLTGGDALLVRDINNDGVINTGTEIFGDQTLLKNGQRAANGMAALADLDINQDGKVDEQDSDFNSLKVWVDSNHDGVSIANELFKLEIAGIQSLNVTVDHIANTTLAGGIQKETASFTWLDGSSGLMADVDFQSNALYSCQRHSKIDPFYLKNGKVKLTPLISY